MACNWRKCCFVCWFGSRWFSNAYIFDTGIFFMWIIHELPLIDLVFASIRRFCSFFFFWARQCCAKTDGVCSIKWLLNNPRPCFVHKNFWQNNSLLRIVTGRATEIDFVRDDDIAFGEETFFLLSEICPLHFHFAPGLWWISDKVLFAVTMFGFFGFSFFFLQTESGYLICNSGITQLVNKKATEQSNMEIFSRAYVLFSIWMWIHVYLIMLDVWFLVAV